MLYNSFISCIPYCFLLKNFRSSYDSTYCIKEILVCDQYYVIFKMYYLTNLILLNIQVMFNTYFGAVNYIRSHSSFAFQLTVLIINLGLQHFIIYYYQHVIFIGLYIFNSLFPLYRANLPIEAASRENFCPRKVAGVSPSLYL